MHENESETKYDDLEDEAFTASSSRPNNSPSMARMHDMAIFMRNGFGFEQKEYEESGDAWVPTLTNTAQYLQINLGRETAMYGVTMSGPLLLPPNYPLVPQ